MKVELNDQWLINNGYFELNDCSDGIYSYEIITGTEKWRKLFETCITKTIVKITDRHVYYKLITIELLLEIITEGKTKRFTYRKKQRPMGYLTIKERQELKHK